MVIQRIQSLYLLAAAILMAVLTLAVPAGHLLLPGEKLAVTLLESEMMHLVIINLLVAVLALVSIFLYKNLRLQIKVTQISTVLCIAALVLYLCAFVFRTPVNFEASVATPVIMYCVSVVCLVLAYRGENSDRRKLSSYDRLR